MEDSEKRGVTAKMLKDRIIRIINEEDDIGVLSFILRLAGDRDRLRMIAG